MHELYQQLLRYYQEMTDISRVLSVLHWDQSTYMPPGGTAARSRQTATLGRIFHEKATADELGKLLDDLKPYEESLPYDSDEASVIRVGRRNFEWATKVPADFMGRFYEHIGTSYQIWTQARPANDFEKIRPYLEKTLDFSREHSAFYPELDHPADARISQWNYGMTVATIQPLFAELRRHLVPLVEAIRQQPPPRTDFLHRHYPEADQERFGLMVIEKYGYDLNRGRQDRTHHPFCTKFSIGDVRITTRFREDDVSDALFSTLHEAGHGMYEQGINPAYEGTPLDRGTSAGVHESQSRLWENVVGRSREFWTHFFPKLKAVFPEQLHDVDTGQFYRAINKVEPSLIRVDADEVTYNLHVMIRFDLANEMLENKLAVKDLPEAWNARYTSDLGITPPHDKDGCMQDVHWFHGMIGGSFPGYTLGNILSGQFFEAALNAHPGIPSEIEKGQFEILHGWLKENIYQHGSKYTAPELIERVTGKSMTIEPYMTYLKTKYGELYEL